MKLKYQRAQCITARTVTSCKYSIMHYLHDEAARIASGSTARHDAMKKVWGWALI